MSEEDIDGLRWVHGQNSKKNRVFVRDFGLGLLLA